MGRSDGVAFSSEDDSLLFSLLSEHGMQWKVVLKMYNRNTLATKRSYSSLRNRYQRVDRQKRLLERGQLRAINRCRECGEMKRGHICRGKNILLHKDVQDDDTGVGLTTDTTSESALCPVLDEDDGDDINLVSPLPNPVSRTFERAACATDLGVFVLDDCDITRNDSFDVIEFQDVCDEFRLSPSLLTRLQSIDFEILEPALFSSF